MKKFKRTLALIGAVLLLLLYVSTFLFAFLDHSASMGLLKASVACTVILPVLLYAYALVYRAIRKDNDDSDADT